MEDEIIDEQNKAAEKLANEAKELANKAEQSRNRKSVNTTSVTKTLKSGLDATQKKNSVVNVSIAKRSKSLAPEKKNEIKEEVVNENKKEDDKTSKKDKSAIKGSNPLNKSTTQKPEAKPTPTPKIPKSDTKVSDKKDDKKEVTISKASAKQATSGSKIAPKKTTQTPSANNKSQSSKQNAELEAESKAVEQHHLDPVISELTIDENHKPISEPETKGEEKANIEAAINTNEKACLHKAELTTKIDEHIADPEISSIIPVGVPHAHVCDENANPNEANIENHIEKHEDHNIHIKEDIIDQKPENLEIPTHHDQHTSNSAEEVSHTIDSKDIAHIDHEVNHNHTEEKVEVQVHEIVHEHQEKSNEVIENNHNHSHEELAIKPIDSEKTDVTEEHALNEKDAQVHHHESHSINDKDHKEAVELDHSKPIESSEEPSEQNHNHNSESTAEAVVTHDESAKTSEIPEAEPTKSDSAAIIEQELHIKAKEAEVTETEASKVSEEVA